MSVIRVPNNCKVLNLSFGMDTKPSLAHLFNTKSLEFQGIFSISCSFAGYGVKVPLQTL